MLSKIMPFGLQPVAVSPRLSATIDFLRWSSALLVLLFHVRISLVRDDDLRYAVSGVIGEIVRSITGAGPAAVMCFFVLSGYLVGGTVVNRVAQARFRFNDYMLDRATRLYVVLLPALVVGLSVDMLRISQFGLAPFEGKSSYSVGTIAANVVFLQNLVVPPAGSNRPLWSLANEAWYYVIFPLLFLAIVADRPLRVRMWLAAAGMGLLAVGGMLDINFLGIFPAWLLGVLVRFAPRPIISSPIISWALVIVAIFSGHIVREIIRLDYPIPAIAVANLLLTISHRQPECSARSLQINGMLAGFSYSLYLTHSWMMHLLLSLTTGHATVELPVDWRPLTGGAALCAILVLFAWGFAQLTERHTAAVRRSMSGRSRLWSRKGRRLNC